MASVKMVDGEREMFVVKGVTTPQGPLKQHRRALRENAGPLLWCAGVCSIILIGLIIAGLR